MTTDVLAKPLDWRDARFLSSLFDILLSSTSCTPSVRLHANHENSSHGYLLISACFRQTKLIVWEAKASSAAREPPEDMHKPCVQCQKQLRLAKCYITGASWRARVWLVNYIWCIVHNGYDCSLLNIPSVVFCNCIDLVPLIPLATAVSVYTSFLFALKRSLGSVYNCEGSPLMTCSDLVTGSINISGLLSH